MMDLVFAAGVDIVAACGVYLLLRMRTCSILLGQALLSYATNLFLFGSGRLSIGQAPISVEGTESTRTRSPKRVWLETSIYFEAVLSIAMMGFIGTCALAKYVLRGDLME